MNAGVNQRASTASEIAAMPPALTLSMRAFHKSAGAMRAAVLARTSRSIRAGAWMPSHMPIMPPSDSPQNIDAVERQVIEQRHDVATETLDRIRSRRDTDDWPCPRVSYRNTRMAARELRHLRFPHREIGAERIREHEHRRADRTVEAVVEANVGEVGERHA